MRRLLIALVLVVACDPTLEQQVKWCVDSCDKVGMHVETFIEGTHCMCMAGKRDGGR